MINNLTISPEAKAVRLKEFHKQTAKKFTLAWFLEHWRGQRSPWYAWLTWSFYGKLLIALITVPPLIYFTHLKMDANFTSSMPLPLLIALSIYTVFSAVILWKCSRNATSKQSRIVTKVLAIYFMVRAFI